MAIWWTGDPEALITADARALVQRPAWHAHAACRGRPDFLATMGSVSAATPAIVATCSTCPVRADCARSALEAMGLGVWVMGVWAGVLLGTKGGRREAWRALAEVAGEPGHAQRVPR